MSNKFCKLIRDDSGRGTVELGVILAAGSVAGVTAATVGEMLASIFEHIANTLESTRSE